MNAWVDPEGDWRRQLEDEGHVLLPGIFGLDAVAQIIQALEGVFAGRVGAESAIRGEEGSIYAARNVLSLWPGVAQMWRQGSLPQVLAALLGPAYGLVRVLFFDKPPRQTWSLPWHKDLTIAVRDNRLPSTHFSKPTRKAGVPHVEAPRAVLEDMLTARIHLDAVTAENGPLKVVPGSHRTGKALVLEETPPQTILAQAGDVLLMRPLLTHCSGKSHPDTQRHRRILHLEFAAHAELPDGYTWHDFLPGAPLSKES